MSLIFTILIIWLLYLLLRPVWRVWTISRKFRNGDPSVFNDLFGNPGAQQSNASRDRNGNRRSGWSMPGIKRKKINKDVGEYVKYQEVKVEEQSRTTSSGGETRQSYSREEQITDVEWEDLP